MSQHPISHVELGQMQLDQQTAQIQTRLMTQQAQRQHEQRQQRPAVHVSNRPQLKPQQLAQLKVQMPMRYQQYMAQMQVKEEKAQSHKQQQRHARRQSQVAQEQTKVQQLEQLRQQKAAQLRRNSSRGEQSEEIVGTKSMFSDHSANNAVPLDPDYGRGIFLNRNENEGRTRGLSLNHTDGRGIIRHDINERDLNPAASAIFDSMGSERSTVNEYDKTTLSESAISRSASGDSHMRPKASVQHHPSPSVVRKAGSGHSPVPPELSSRRRHKAQTSSKDSTAKMPTNSPPLMLSHNISDIGVKWEELWTPQILSSTHGVSITLHENGPGNQGIWTSYTISEDHTGGSEAISQLRLAALRRKEYPLIHFQETQRLDTNDVASTYSTPINPSGLDLQPGRGVPEYDPLRDSAIKSDHFGIGPHDPSFNADPSDDDILETFDADSFLSTAINNVDINDDDVRKNVDFDSFLNTANEKGGFQDGFNWERVDGSDSLWKPTGLRL